MYIPCNAVLRSGKRRVGPVVYDSGKPCAIAAVIPAAPVGDGVGHSMESGPQQGIPLLLIGKLFVFCHFILRDQGFPARLEKIFFTAS